MIYAGSSQKNAPKVLKIISMEIKKLLKRGLSKRELEFFKTQVKGSILLGSDDVESRMNSIAVNEMVFGEYRPVDEVVAQIDKVSLGSIHEYLERFIDFNKSGVMLVGDVDEEKGSRWVENSFEK
jgi:predicted Zn-dependent peptidase